MPSLPDLSHISPDDLSRLDIGVLIVIGLSALWGLTRGFTTELSGLVAWASAVILTYRFHAALVPWISPYLHESWLAQSASAAVLFIVILLTLTTIAGRVGAAVRGTLFGGVDRILGAIFGILRGYVMLIALYLLAGSFFGSWTSYLMQGSFTGPYIEAGASRLAGYLPHSLQPHLASPPTSGHDASL
ncbi:CvpA family protein [Gluconobacter cerinus]|uniref:CvpA family protein n=1 Tax=Gluconobacter cerinus TaxID=38307 RepID=UPI003AB8FF8C